MAKAALKATPKKAKSAAPKPAAKKAGPAKKRSAPAYTVKAAKEITATFLDSVGLTAKVAAAVAAENVNILAGTGYSASAMRRKATFTLIVDNLAKAERALERIGADDIQESSVILVETANKVGSLKKISRIIADAGINIYYFYSTTSSGKTATCVFKTADDKKTMKVLREAK
ncbi:MAG: ACT domain-containing protein [Thermodesulfovibrionales bacterium]